MKCKLLLDSPAAPTIPPNTDILPKGKIIDHPQAYILVQIGMAESVDDECTKKVGMTPEQLTTAQYTHIRTRKGIHPTDFARYDNGELDGYNLDGTDKPGPNYVDPDEDDEEESNLILPETYYEEEELEEDE